MDRILALLKIFLIIIAISAVDAQSQSNSTSTLMGESAAINDVDKATSSNKMVEILGVDPTSFPKIKINIFIDKFCALTGNLEKENFKVMEDDKAAAIDNFYFTGNATGQRLDLAIVFDTSGSMDNEIKALQLKVQDLISKINSSKLDARYSLITFRADVEATKVNWTSDSNYFINAIGKFSASGGDSGPENSLGGIETVLSFGFRPDAQKVVLVITDEPSHQKGDGYRNSTYTVEGVNKNLSTSGAILIAVSPDFRNPSVNPGVPRSDLPKYADMRVIANEIGLWIDINSADFSTILDQFKGILTGTYVIEYTSPDQMPSKNRTVLFSVDAPGCVAGSDASAYVSPGSKANLNSPPAIESMTSDKASPQDAGTAINWTANAVDLDGDLILYKFLLDGRPMTPWAEDKTWIWMPGQAGHYRVEVQVRDAKHAGPDEQDDRRSESFTINEPKPLAPANQPPIVDELSAVQIKAKEITWTANATDSDGDQILYRYFLNNKSMTDWIDRNKWILNATEANAGENQVEVRIRDGEHAGFDSYDDAKSVKFNLSSMKLMTQTWERTFGGPDMDEGYSVQQTSDGGYIVVGRAGDSADIWLIKTDSSGNMEWDKTFGGSGLDLPGSVQQTSDGGYVVFAQTTSYGAGGRDAWLIKTDSSGNKQWDKTFGGKEEEPSFSGQQTSDGGYILAGSTSSYGEGSSDILLIKTDQNGNVLWDKTFGGSGYDSANSVRQTTDGGYVIGGLTFVGANDQRGWAIKTDSSGNQVWTKVLSEGLVNIESVRQTADGGYIIVGSGLLIKTDSRGDEEWRSRTFEIGSEKSVQQTTDGGYIITGDTFSGMKNATEHMSDVGLIKTDSLGNEMWNRTFGSSDNDEAYSVQMTSDGGYIIAGMKGSYWTNEGDGSRIETDGDLWLIKTDDDGNV